MSIKEESLWNGMSSLKRFTLEELPRRIHQFREAASRKKVSRTNGQRGRNPSAADEDSSVVASPAKQTTLNQPGSFAPYSVILGKCDDDLPLTIELTNPAPGSILITGDSGSGKTRLMQSILRSAAVLNNPNNMQFYIITQDPREYEELSLTPNCQQILPVEETALQGLVLSLLEKAEQFRRSGPKDPTIMLAIDNLAALSPYLNFELTAALFRLVRHGPRSRIWIIATLPAESADLVHEKILEAFRTRLVGKISSILRATDITGESSSPATELVCGTQFCVPVKGEWVEFWIND